MTLAPKTNPKPTIQMEAKTKAKELVEKMTENFPYDFDAARDHAKACAIICVDEILNSYKKNLEEGRVDFITHNPIDYWQQVKAEIEKL